MSLETIPTAEDLKKINTPRPLNFNRGEAADWLRETMETAVAAFPDDPQGWYLRGFGEKTLGSWSAAEKYYTISLTKKVTDDEQVASTYLERSAVRLEMAIDTRDKRVACRKLNEAKSDYEQVSGGGINRYVKNHPGAIELRARIAALAHRKCGQ